MMTPVNNRLNPIVTAVQNGDVAAANDVLRALYPAILSYCRSRMPQEGTFSIADETAVSICGTFLRALHRYRVEDEAITRLVYVISARGVAEAKYAGNDEDLDPDAPPSPLASLTTHTPMEEALSILSPLGREIIRLRIIVGLSAAETAAVLDSTPGAIRVAQYRAIAKLADHAGDGGITIRSSRATQGEGAPSSPGQASSTAQEDSDTVDLLALRAVDRYGNFLAAGQRPRPHDDVAPQLTELLVEWRKSIGSIAPVPPFPTVDSLLGVEDEDEEMILQPAVAGLEDIVTPTGLSDGRTADRNSGSSDSSTDSVDDAGSGGADSYSDYPEPQEVCATPLATWKREALRAVGSAIAVLIMATGGLAIAIQSAGINDPLWSLNKSLFASNANDIELTTYLKQDIERAKTLAEKGHSDDAHMLLERVVERARSIGADYRRESVLQSAHRAEQIINQIDKEKQREASSR